MCGRYTLRRIDIAAVHLDAYPQPEFEEFSELRIIPRFNIAPSQLVPIVRLDGENRRAMGLVRWGLIPHWTKGKPKSQPINARAETLATSGMFRQAFERRRCLVPADGFYEWQKLDAKIKQPMYVTRRDDGVFAFGGLWERWKPDESAEPVDTFTIITTTPNPLMSPIHDRMPVILAQADYGRWLDRNIPGSAVTDLLRPAPPDEMQARPVSTTVNSPRNETPDCIALLASDVAKSE